MYDVRSFSSINLSRLMSPCNVLSVPGTLNTYISFPEAKLPTALVSCSLRYRACGFSLNVNVLHSPSCFHSKAVGLLQLCRLVA